MNDVRNILILYEAWVMGRVSSYVLAKVAGLITLAESEFVSAQVISWVGAAYHQSRS
jgi:hypothetical protein